MVSLFLNFRHVLLLCPGLWQVPQSPWRFGGGGFVAAPSPPGSGVPALLPPGFGTEGSGHTVSLSLSGQKGCICSYRYYCRSALSPRGGRIDGNSSKSGSHGAFSRSISTSGRSHCSRMNILPGDEEDTRKWWYFLSLVIFFILIAKKSVQSYVGTIVLPSS